jgi:hypothetical protein
MVWGPPWTRYPVHGGPRTGFRLDGVHCDPRPVIGFSRRFQRHDAGQKDAIDHGESVLAGAASGLDQDALFQEIADRPLHGAFAQLGMPLDRALGAPDARTVIARLVGQEHDDLLARGAAEAAFGAFVRDTPAHCRATTCTGFVQKSRLQRAICREIKRAFLQPPSQATEKVHILLCYLVTPIGFEPITCPLGGGCSIQLSHGATFPSPDSNVALQVPCR